MRGYVQFPRHTNIAGAIKSQQASKRSAVRHPANNLGCTNEHKLEQCRLLLRNQRQRNARPINQLQLLWRARNLLRP